MMTWLQEWGTLASALVVLFVPGALAALIIGLRGFTVAAVAAPLSLAAIGAASLVNAVVPFRWGVAAWIVTAVVLVLVAVAVDLLTRRVGAGPWREHAPPASWHTWLPFAAV